MMKLKSYLSMIVALAVLTTLISGCSSSNKEQDTKTSIQTTQQSTSTQPVTIKLIGRKLSQANPDNPIKPIIEKKLGITLDIDWRAPSDYGQQCQVILSSGSFPDMMEVWWSNAPAAFDDFAKSGQIIPLDDLINQYGPNIQKARTPGTWWKAPDGKIYGVPCRYAEMTDDCILIRQDWLDNLGLKAPTSLEELYNVAKAFTLNDPDQNGKQDTVGIGEGKDYGGTHVLLYATYGVQWNQWNLVNDKMVWWGIRPEALEAAKEYRKLYQDGFVEQEFPILGRSEYIKKMNASKYGIFWAQPTQMTESTSDQWREFVTTNPTAKISVLKPFAKAGVDKPTFGGVPELQFINQVIFKDAKNPEKCIQLLDYLATDEGSDLANFGIKGQTWEDNNGKFAYKNLSPDEMKVSGAGLYPWLFKQKYFLKNSSDLALSAAETYKPYAVRNPMPYATDVEQKYSPSLKGDPSQGADLTTSTFTKIIVDKNADPDKLWQDYLDKWNSSGGKEMTDSVNAEYQKNKTKK
ncbi:MAG TPA: hypothetical protein VIK78_19940 [Ruminiclostridium sp.]